MDEETCPYCGEPGDGKWLECPQCYRDGCDACMPAGRGVPCPDCEENDEA